jgi:preprotein translocase subunit YajC
VTPVLLLRLAQAQGGGSPIWGLVVQFTIIGLIIYWLLIRPQRKERDRHEEMVRALKKGDEVVTAGGIIGTIVHVEDDRITLKTAETTRLVLERSRVTRLATAPKEGGAA